MRKKIKLIGIFVFAFGLCLGGNARAEDDEKVESKSVTQQGNTVTGTVRDAQGPVIGASISVKGTSIGNVSDVRGNFTLNGVKQGAVLVVSYIGYATQEITYNGQSPLRITLSEGLSDLDEVIVVAYGTTKKSTFTGSASLVKSEQIEKISAVSLTESLQGMTAGVNITNNEGSPGRESRIQIRGIGNLRNAADATNPLYIVDGVPYDGQLNSIANSDIESITILKDAAASSLYGSRAANGVVVITTKRGKAGAPVVNFKAAWGTSDNAVANPTKADPYQTMLYIWRANYNDGVYLDGKSPAEAAAYATSLGISQSVTARTNSKGETVYVSPFKSVPLNQYVFYDNNFNPYVNPDLEMVWDKSDYDFYGAVFSRKLRQDYSVDLSGASADGKTNYYTSFSHLNDQGYGHEQYYKRYSFRAKVTSQIKSWLSMGGNLAYSYARQAGTGANRMIVFTNTLNSPWLRNADNTDWEYSLKTGNRMTERGKNVKEFFDIHVLDGMGGAGDYWNNPNDYSFNNDEHGMMTAHYFAEIILPFNIRYKTNVNYDDILQTHYAYNSAVHSGSQLEPYGITVKTSGGGASRRSYKTASLTWNNLLTWNKAFGDHNVDLLAGQEFYSKNYTQIGAGGSGIMEIGKYEMTANTRDWWTESSIDKYALFSLFGQAQYNYGGKYYASASLRRDGSSRFHPDQRWGNFYSAGAGWRLSQESFISDISWLNNLYLRASYGTAGNDNIGGYYAYQAYYETYNLYGLPGFRKSTNEAKDLHWESNQQFNVAADFSLFNRVSGTIEYYRRNSNGLLSTRDLPYSAVAGAGSKNTNLGDVLNTGIELSASVAVIKTKDFSWNINANFTTLHNEIKKLPSGAYTFSQYSTYKMEEGHSVMEHFLVKVAGVDPEDGRQQYWVQDGNGNWEKTKDVLDIDSGRDGQYVGSAIPKGFGSITNTFAYKNFDFSFMWYGSYGSKLYNHQGMEQTSIRAGVSPVSDMVDGIVWMKPGDNATLPRWSMRSRSIAGQNTTCDQFLVDNSFLRLRNLTLGYTLPKQILNKAGISNLRFYVTGDNLLTFSPVTKYHIDPEAGLSGNNYNGNGYDSGIQGARRVFMGGIQISF